MRLSKTVALPNQNKCRVTYGTTNYKKLNSIFVDVQTWLEPICSESESLHEVKMLRHRVRSHVSRILNRELFKERFITNMDIKLSGVRPFKKSFLSLELTLFLNGGVDDFKCAALEREIRKLTSSLICNHLSDNAKTRFHLRKNSKKIHCA